MTQIITSGEDALYASDAGWRSVLEVPGTALVNSITVINEGDTAGFWRLWSSDADVSPSIRLPARSAVTLPSPGFSGRIEVIAERGLCGPVYAFGL